MAIGSIIAEISHTIIDNDQESASHAKKPNNYKKDDVEIINKNIINNNQSSVKKYTNQQKDVNNNKKSLVNPKRRETAAFIPQGKECIISNGSGNINFSNGLFFKFYTFTGFDGKYNLEIGNNESGRLYLKLGQPPITVYFKKNEYSLWTTKPRDELFHICIKMQKTKVF